MSESEVSITISAIDAASEVISNIQSQLEELGNAGGGVAIPGAADAGAVVGDLSQNVDGANESIVAMGGAVDDAGASFDAANESIVTMNGSVYEGSDSFAAMGDSANAAGDELTNTAESMNGVNQSAMWSMQGIMGLSTAIRSGITSYEELEMIQMRMSAATLAVHRAQDTYNSDLAKYGAGSQQAQLAAEALSTAQQRLSYYQQRSGLDWVNIATTVPMAAAGLGQFAASVPGLASMLGGVSDAIVPVVTGLSAIPVVGWIAAGAVVAGATAVAAYQGNWWGFRDDVNNAGSALEKFGGHAAQDLAGAGKAVEDFGTQAAKSIGGGAAWLAQGAEGIGGAITKGAGHIGGFLAGGLQSGLGAVGDFGKSVGQEFMSMFSSGGQVHQYLSQGTKQIQQLWSDIWSPTGAGANGFKNIPQIAFDALTGPAGIALQFAPQIQQLMSQISPALTSFQSTIGSTLSGAFKGISGIGGGITGGFDLSSLTSAFSGLTSALAPVQNAISAISSAWNSFTGSLGTDVSSGISKIASAFAPVQTAVSAISSAWQTFAGEVQANIASFIDKIAAAFAPIVTAVSNIQSDFGTFAGDVQQDFSSALSKLAADFGPVTTAISNALSAAAGFVAQLDAIPKSITTVINEIINTTTTGSIGTISPGNGELSAYWGPPLTANPPPGYTSSGGPGSRGPTPMQHGGPINETGLYLLHEGEYVVPPNAGNSPTASAPATMTPSTITLTNNNTLRLDGQVISRLVQQQMIQRRTMASAYKWS